MGENGIDLTILAMAAPFLAAAVAPALHRLFGGLAAWILAVVPALIFLWFLRFLPITIEHGGVVDGFPWIWQIDVSFTYLIDGLSVLFALLVSGGAALAIIHAGGVMRDDPGRGRFLALLMAFFGASLGVFLADDFLMLIIYWETSALLAWLLISGRSGERAVRDAQWMFVITGGGGLALLAGFLLMILASGASTMTEAFPLAAAFKDHPYYEIVLGLILLGAVTRAAQFPFHRWMYGAMRGATPAAALFGSSTLAVAGVYLVMRVHPILGTTVPWSAALTLLGGLTVVVSTFRAVRQIDLAEMMAASGTAALGLGIMLMGTSLPAALMAGVIVVLAHGVARLSLTLILASVAQEAGTLNRGRIGGLRRTMPFAFYAAIVAGSSLAAVPLTLGAYAAAASYDSMIGEAPLATVILIISVIAHIGFVAVGMAVVLRPFTGPSVVTPKYPTDGSAAQRFAPLVASVLLLVLTLAGDWTLRALILPATVAIAAAIPQQPVSPISGVFENLGLLAATWVAGMLLFSRLEPAARTLSAVANAIGIRVEAWPEFGAKGSLLARMASNARRFAIRNPALPLLAGFSIVAIGLMTVFAEGPDWPLRPALAYYEWMVFAVGAIGLFVVLSSATATTAVIGLAIPGLAVALMAAFASAPDVALIVAFGTMVTIVLLFFGTSDSEGRAAPRRSVLRKCVDSAVAIASGVAFCGLLVSATTDRSGDRADLAFRVAADEAGGQVNLVNLALSGARMFDLLALIALFLVVALIAWTRTDQR